MRALIATFVLLIAGSQINAQQPTPLAIATSTLGPCQTYTVRIRVFRSAPKAWLTAKSARLASAEANFRQSYDISRYLKSPIKRIEDLPLPVAADWSVELLDEEGRALNTSAIISFDNSSVAARNRDRYLSPQRNAGKSSCGS